MGKGKTHRYGGDPWARERPIGDAEKTHGYEGDPGVEARPMDAGAGQSGLPDANNRAHI